MLNENIRNLRKAKGLSQEELAIKLNVGYPDFLKIPINKNIRPTIFDDNWSFLM